MRPKNKKTIKVGDLVMVNAPWFDHQKLVYFYKKYILILGHIKFLFQKSHITRLISIDVVNLKYYDKI